MFRVARLTSRSIFAVIKDVNARDVALIHTIAVRLKPFRIDLQEFTAGTNVVVKPVLVLEDKWS